MYRATPYNKFTAIVPDSLKGKNKSCNTGATVAAKGRRPLPWEFRATPFRR